MKSSQLDVPVALVFFNRPQCLEKVFDGVRRAKPRQLFLIQDGPRPGFADDRANIAACRAIVDKVDWECRVLRNYAANNLGCGVRPYTGISWVFEHVDRAIILEDDCVPAASFFSFCSLLLERYRDDERVGMICGLNHFGSWPCGDSYFFAMSGANNGWATWKRVWNQYDFSISPLSNMDKQTVYHRFPFRRAAKARLRAWRSARRRILRGENVSFWDLQLEACKFLHPYLTIIPADNLIQNIGTGNDAAHNRSVSPFNNLPLYEIPRLVHPSSVEANLGYDERYYRYVCPPFYRRVMNKIRLCASLFQQ